jgi:UDP-3-O-acyl-N-acetylglucosamine deacetylase
VIDAASSQPLRRRLRRAARFRGAGLFSGKAVQLSVHPGVPDRGWCWAVGRAPAIALEPRHLCPQPRRSTLFDEPTDFLVQLPEHILAALLMLDVDDCTIRFHDGEAPVLDGSALPFVRGLRAAGIAGPTRPCGLRVEVNWEGRDLCWQGGTAPARARTFISAQEAREVGGLGSFPGARPGCALVFGPQHSSRYGGRPRLRDEPAWHKLADLLGDLGPHRARGRLAGLLQATAPSHSSNPELIEQALAAGSLTYID